MPAAAVIPAPIAYIKVVAVKKLVVETSMVASDLHSSFCHTSYLANVLCPINLGCRLVASFTVNKLGCSKQTIV